MFHVLTLTYLQPLDVIDRDPYQQAGLVAYERLTFNGAFRAPSLSG